MGSLFKGEPQSAELLVRAGDAVVTLTEELVAQTIGSLPDPDLGLQLGTVYGDKPVLGKVRLPLR